MILEIDSEIKDGEVVHDQAVILSPEQIDQIKKNQDSIQKLKKNKN